MGNVDVLIAVTATTAFRHYVCVRVGKQKSIRDKDGVKMRAVGHVSAINLFPIKSVRGIHLNRARCSPTGLTTMDKKLHDRYDLTLTA